MYQLWPPYGVTGNLQRATLVTLPIDSKGRPSRSQRPSALRRGSAVDRLLGLRVWIPPGTWTPVCFECCVLSGIGLCYGPITQERNPYLCRKLYFKILHTYFSRYSDSLRAVLSKHRIPVRARFLAPVQTGPWAHSASYTMGTGSFPVVKRPGRGISHPPPSSAEVKERVELYPDSPSWLSWTVLGWHLHFDFTIRIFL